MSHCVNESLRLKRAVETHNDACQPVLTAFCQQTGFHLAGEGGISPDFPVSGGSRNAPWPNPGPNSALGESRFRPGATAHRPFPISLPEKGRQKPPSPPEAGNRAIQRLFLGLIYGRARVHILKGATERRGFSKVRQGNSQGRRPFRSRGPRKKNRRFFKKTSRFRKIGWSFSLFTLGIFPFDLGLPLKSP